MRRLSMRSCSMINTIAFTIPVCGAGETESIADCGMMNAKFQEPIIANQE
jgi:hypothetical protein